MARQSNPRMKFSMNRVGVSRLEIEAGIASEIEQISPVVDRVMKVIEASRCVSGVEFGVEMALREAVNNAVLHGNGLNPRKWVEIHCICELGVGVSLVVRDEGQGFDLNRFHDPLAPENLLAERGRGILLMRYGMDEIRFERKGSEVHMRKMPSRPSRRQM